MRPPIEFFVPGEPKGQPRPRAFARKMGNKFVARVYESGTAEHWKSQIASAAKSHIPDQPLEGPLHVSLLFFFPRPKSHYRTGKYAGVLRSNAPKWHTSKPDRDNSEKAVLDALTTLGFWKDDSQVCDGPIRKFYTGNAPGCSVFIRECEQ